MFNYNNFKNDFLKGNINPFAILDSSKQVNFRERVFSDLLFSTLISMFEYEKSEEYRHIDDRTIETTLILNGVNGWCYDDNKKIVCGFAYDGGKIDINGIGETISINLLNGKGYKKIKNIDKVVVGLNNNIKSADYDIYRYADILSNISLSEQNNIDFTRINPLYIAKNNKIKELIKVALSKLKRGEPTIISDNSFNLNNDDIIKSTSLTDNVAIDKLQYLSTYYNAVLRRFYTEYGHPLSEGTKQAQQSITEISSNHSASMIKPLDRLKQREKMCTELMETFGGNIKVKFSDAWNINETDIVNGKMKEDIINENN